MTVLSVLVSGLLAVGPVSPAPAGDGVWPLDPRPAVAEGFDPPADRYGAGHRGVDLVGRLGQPVRAALAGRVSFVGAIAGRGVVVVDHAQVGRHRVRTTYEPVVGQVRRGQEVRAGEVLGLLQVAGSHCFPVACLHWGLLRGEEYLDPLTLVGGGPVRLKPLGGMPIVAASVGPGLVAAAGPRGVVAR